MAGFGRPNPFPFRFGGGMRAHEVALAAMLDDMAPILDVSEDGAVFAETYAYARALLFIWAVNGRVRGGTLTPSRMLETLTTWEAAQKLRPSAHDTLTARRARVAARLRGIAGNAIADIEEAAREAAGLHFAALLTVPASMESVYWPGVNPGPPGYEWASNRATVAVKLNRLTASDAAFAGVIDRVWEALRDLLPAWMTLVVGANDGGFICNVGIVGVTLL
jgi:hypothetical protein